MTHKHRILIVDDDPLSLKLLEARFPRDKYKTIRAHNGKDALVKVAEDPPDLILLDIMMPGMNGYEVTERLKGDPTTQDIPVVLVTALDGRESKTKGLEAGANDFLSKPVNTAELMAKVRSFLCAA